MGAGGSGGGGCGGGEVKRENTENETAFIGP